MTKHKKYIIGQLSPKVSKWLIPFWWWATAQYAEENADELKELLTLLPYLPGKGTGLPKWRPVWINWLKSKGYDVWEDNSGKILIKFSEKEAVWIALKYKHPPTKK